MNRCVFLMLFFLATPLLTRAHGDKLPLSFSGIVSEKHSGHPVEGAVISLERNGEVIQSTKSDSKGEFLLKLETTQVRMDQLQLRIYKSGYEAVGFLPVNASHEHLEIRLEKKSPIQILKPGGTGSAIIAI